MTLFGIDLVVIKLEYFSRSATCFGDFHFFFLFPCFFFFSFFFLRNAGHISNCGHFVFIPSSKVLITSPKIDHARYPEKHESVPPKCWLVSFNVTPYLNADLGILVSLMPSVQVSDSDFDCIVNYFHFSHRQKDMAFMSSKNMVDLCLLYHKRHIHTNSNLNLGWIFINISKSLHYSIIQYVCLPSVTCYNHPCIAFEE